MPSWRAPSLASRSSPSTWRSRWDDRARIARGAREAAPSGADFSIRGKGDPSESRDVELCFRIRGVDQPEEALARALEICALGRRSAGLGDDVEARASLTA